MLTVQLDKMDLQPGMRVLDLGCGRGRHLHALYWHDVPLDVVGVDLSHGEVKAAFDGFFQLPPPEPFSELRSATTSAADAARLPFKNQSFDRIICSEVLEHVPDPDLVLAEIERILKPGGLFISKTVCNLPLKWRIMKLILPLVQMLGKAPYVNFMSAQQWENIIESGGFKIVESGNYPKTAMSRYIVARKI